MNRRDALKLAAGAVAGASAAVGGGSKKDTVALMAEALAKIPERSPEVERHLAEHRARFDRMLRREQAIDLGDRTAEELGLRFWIARGSMPPAEGPVMWRATFSNGLPFDVTFCDDPDPLTAVEKAREAALAFYRYAPRTALPDVSWRQQQIDYKTRPPLQVPQSLWRSVTPEEVNELRKRCDPIIQEVIQTYGKA